MLLQRWGFVSDREFQEEFSIGSKKPAAAL